MPHWIWPTMIALVVVDTAVAFYLIRYRITKVKSTGIDFARIHQIGRAVDERLVTHMQTAWSGQSSDLPEALRRAVEITRQIAATQSIELDEPSLRLVVTGAVCGHKFASRGQVGRAFATLDSGNTAAA